MSRARRIALKLRALFAKARVEDELDEELRFHLEMQIAANRQRGLSPPEARTAALRDFGGIERFKEECRDARGVRPLENVVADIRYGLRMVRNNPAFSGAAIAILALGIGVTTAVFSVARAYLLQPLPYPAAERLVQILRGPDRGTFVPVDGLADVDWSALSDVFDRMVSWDLDGFNLRGGDRPEAVDGAWVNPDYFRMFGVTPALGRVFDEEDVRRGGRTAVISYGLWQRRFGGDSSVIGKTINAASADRPFEEDIHTIVGVLPQDFWYLNRFTELLVPLLEERPPYMARLATGMSLEDAEARLNAAVAEYVSDAPPGWKMTLVSAHDEHVYEIRPALLALLGAVAFVLVIACANVGGLWIARAIHRQRETAIRAALGAGRRRILQQLLTESVLLSVMAGVLGVLVALSLLEVAGAATQNQLRVNVPGGLERLAVDWMVLAFALGLGLFTGLAFGALPAIAACRRNLNPSLQAAGARTGEGTRHARGRDTLIVAQIALSFALLVGAGLMMRSVMELERAELGFEPRGVIRAGVLLPEDDYPASEPRRIFFDQARAAIGRLSGVRDVGLVWPYPFRPGGGRPVTPEGSEHHAEVPRAVYYAADPGYFWAMGVPLLRGRLFERGDHFDAAPVALVSETLAKRLWPGAEPIGRRLKLGPPDSEGEWRTVIGVVSDVRETFSEEPEPDVYIPHAQTLRRSMYLMVKTQPEGGPSAEKIQRAVASVDPDLPVSEVMAMNEVVARAGSHYRFLSILLAGFALFAVVLSTTGLYSTLAYAVSRRAREIAIRIALGAQARGVLGMVVARGAKLVALGLAVGLAASVVVGRALSSQTFGVGPADPLTHFAVALLFAFTALAAMLAPGRRAAKVDPARVLRDEG